MRSLAVLTLLVATLPEPVAACTCMGPESALMARHASEVFRGRVTRIELSGGQWSPVDVTFDVSTVWHGDPASVHQVRTESQSSACGYQFDVGLEYIVVTYQAEDAHMWTGLCLGNELTSLAPTTLAGLGKGHSPRVELAPLVDRETWHPLVILGWPYGFVGLLFMAVVLGRLSVRRG